MLSDRKIKKWFYRYFLLEAVFIALKLCGVLPLPWWAVLFPLWILPTVIILFTIAFAIFVYTRL